MIKKIFVCLILFLHMVFLTLPVMAQVDPEPLPTEEWPSENDDGDTPPIRTDQSGVFGNIGSGRAGDKCKTDVKLDKTTVIDNISFDIPLVPSKVEDQFIKFIVKSLGGGDALLGDIDNQVNELSVGEPGELCIDGSTPNTTDPEAIARGECECQGKANFEASVDFCSKIKADRPGGAEEIAKCQACTRGKPGQKETEGMWTAIGCVNYDLSSFITNVVFTFGIGLGGLVALGCIVYAALIMQTSRGEPEKIQHSRELITSCILGLVLIIFSIFILQFIGVSLLDLGRFGAPLPTN